MSRALLLSLLLVGVDAHASNAGGLPACLTALDTCGLALDTCDGEVAGLDEALRELETALATCEYPVLGPPTGGVASSEDGKAMVYVPPGALEAETVLSVTAVAPVVEAERLSGVYDFGPDQTFLGEVTICLEADPARKGDACLGYLDELSDPPRWKCEDACLDRGGDNTLCGQTDHFTNFAILLSGSAGKGSGCEEPTYLLSRSTGGVASSADGAAFVSVPPGALPRDLAITVTPVTQPPVEAERLSGVYDFGPDGLTFGKAATVCLEADASFLAEACLGYLDTSGRSPEWRCEDPCLEKNDRVLCGKTMHFTSFAVLLTGGADGRCDAGGTSSTTTDELATSAR